MSRATPLLPCALVLILASGCSTEPSGSEPLLEALPRSLSAAEQQVIDAGNQFTFDLFREATRDLPPEKNAFLSPFSASMALGMALNGAGGETFEAMRSALRLGTAPLSEINQGYRDLLDLLGGLSRSTELAVANSVWSDKGFPILPSFVTAARTFFDAEARSLDFRDPATVATINSWVGEKTRNEIPKLLDEIRQDEVAFLINAVYFKGSWRDGFDRGRTRPEPFHGGDGSTRDVSMMNREPGPLRYARGSNYEAVELLYGNGAFAMTVILPETGTTPAEVLSQVDAGAWRDQRALFVEQKLGLKVPKFRLEYERKLNADLTALGMGIAFDGSRADLYGIADVRPERLFISRVLQKTFVDVNEEGTEAAAATVVGVGVTSAPAWFVVDRPFLLVIHERLSGTILFIGQINSL